MDVAVLGATGDIGRQLCTQLIERRVVPTTSRLQLVGRAGGPSSRGVVGLRADLIDAYDEVAPRLDVALAPDEVVADVVVVAAGATLSGGGATSREKLAELNLELFHAYADALVRYGTGDEIVLVVTNPVELGVAVFARALGRHRVIGMGAWLDTLRFRREIALSLGVRRQQVTGFVVGEHGSSLVPLWSTVRVHGLDRDERAYRIGQLRGARTLATFRDELAAARSRLLELVEGDAGDAMGFVDAQPPDVRAGLRPWVTQFCGAKTAAGTANATADMVRVVLDGREIVVAGQVLLDGEVHGLATVTGVPVSVGPAGWNRVLLDDLPPDEVDGLRAAAAAIDDVLRPWGLQGG